jgi:hypothetical protein
MIPVEEQIEFLRCELEHLERCTRNKRQFIPLLVPGMPEHVGKAPDEIRKMIDDLMAP